MKTTTSEHKTFITDLGDVEFSVFFERTIDRLPLRLELGHGMRYFDDSTAPTRTKRKTAT